MVQDAEQASRIYVAHSLWNEQEPMEFGDDDEGKILDLQGGEWNHCSYILQFCSLLTGKRYHSTLTVSTKIYFGCSVTRPSGR